MFMKHLIMTMIYAETLINQAVDSFVSSCFRESRILGNITRKSKKYCQIQSSRVLLATICDFET